MMIGDLRERAVGQCGDAVDGTAGAGEGTLDGEVEGRDGVPVREEMPNEVDPQQAGAAGSETGRWLAHGRARL